MRTNKALAGKRILITVLITALFITLFNTQDVHAASKDNKHGYYYQFLTKSEKKAYNAIVKSCEEQTPQFNFKPMDVKHFWDAWDAVRYDHPEYYWLHYGTTSYHNGDNLTFMADNFIPIDANVFLNQLNTIAKNVANDIKGMNEYEKYRYIYDYIANQVVYGKEEGIDDQSITGALIYGKAVCSGYSDAFKFLCDKAGLFCIKVAGTTKDGDPDGHTWNMIRVDGSYYWVDVTWGDETARKSQMAYGEPNYYTYLCLPDEIFLKDHYISPKLLNNYKGHFRADYPACSSDQYSNFSLMDLQFSYTEEAYGYIQGNLNSGIPYVRMQFDTTEEMYRAIEILHTNNEIWNFANASGYYYGSYYYWYNDILNTLVFEFY